jgi:hypothetical protein
VWDRSYFEATAQLLPVLYLAALIEYRLFRPMEQPEKEKPWLWGGLRLLICFLGLTFALAELSALKVLATGIQTSNDRGISVAAYIIGFLGLVTPLWERAMDVMMTMRHRWHRWLMITAGFLVWFGFLAVVLVWAG